METQTTIPAALAFIIMNVIDYLTDRGAVLTRQMVHSTEGVSLQFRHERSPNELVLFVSENLTAGYRRNEQADGPIIRIDCEPTDLILRALLREIKSKPID